MFKHYLYSVGSQLKKEKSVRRKVSFFFLHETLHILKSRQANVEIEDHMREAMHILESFGNYLPALQYLGGALRISAVMSNQLPSATILRKETCAFEACLIKSSNEKRRNCCLPLVTEIINKFSELEKIDLELIREDLEKTLEAIRKEMAKELVSNFSLQNLFTNIDDDITLNHDHQVLIQEIDRSYAKILRNQSNIRDTLCTMDKSFIYLIEEFKSKLNPLEVRLYLEKLKNNVKTEKSQNPIERFINYLIIIYCKYLQITIVYLTFNQKAEEIAIEFQNFVKNYYEITKMYHEVVGEIFKPGNVPLSFSHRSKVSSMVTNKRSLDEITLDDNVEKFLKDNGLLNQDIAQVFVTQGVTFDILQDFTDEDLKNMGINEIGYRKRILKAIAKYPQDGKELFCERFQIF